MMKKCYSNKKAILKQYPKYILKNERRNAPVKSILMFETSWCPYCRQARKFMDELIKENPKYKELNIKVIDEELHPEIAKQYNYYNVPTYYLESEKVHEGIPNKEIIHTLFENAMSQ